MKYSIFKDNSPKSTIKYFEKIIKEIELPVFVEVSKKNVEHEYMPYSHNIRLFNIETFGVNGKGTTNENSLASAYGELFERLQNQYLIPLVSNDFIVAPDEKIIDITSLDNNELNIFFSDKNLIKNIAHHCNRVKTSYSKYSERYSSLTKEVKEKNKTILVPFFKKKDSTCVYLPIQVINKLQGTTGMCAGNTIEEALVEGLSEICERYSLRQIISNEIIMPEIPQYMYCKYQRIMGILDFYKKNNYEIYIKDASLGIGLPVVCVIAHNKKENLYHITFGSHPSLPVAIERNLTEISQGVDISNSNIAIDYHAHASTKNYEYIENKKKYLIEIIRMGGNILENNALIEKLLSNKKISYLFDEQSWDFVEKNNSNKNFLNSLFKRIEHITDNNVYIRDVSFLGVPSAYIFIPSMSMFNLCTQEDLDKEVNMLNWLDFANDNIEKENLTIETLKSALEYRQIFGMHIFDKQISSLPTECMLFLCSIILQNYQDIYNYADILIARNNRIKIYSPKGIQRYIIAKEYSLLKMNNKSEIVIKEKLLEKFTEQEIEDFYKFINCISFETLKSIIKNQKYCSVSDKILGIEKEYDKVAKIMATLYLKNVPIQEEMKNLF